MTTPSTEATPNRIPVSVITGFLGSGKTTLIGHLVAQPGMDKTALIINEFGEIGLDNQLVETAVENTLLLENGCICCSIRGDLIDTINDLFAKVENNQIPEFSRILIETTGLADPGPIIKSIQNEIALVRRCRLNNVVTMVDGVHGSAQIRLHPEAVVQIAQADTVLLSKSDLAAPEDVEALKRDVLNINPTLAINAIQQGRIDPNILFESAGEYGAVSEDAEHHDHHDHGHSHNEAFVHGDIATWSLLHEDPIDEERLRNWLSMLYTLRPFAMLRMKGLVRLTTSEKPLLIQAVGNRFSPPVWRDGWPGDISKTQLVLIFKGLSPEAMRSSFQTNVLKMPATDTAK